MPEPRTPKIVLLEAEQFTTPAITHLQKQFQVDLNHAHKPDLAELMCSYDAIWCRLQNHFNRAVIQHSTRCKVIATGTTGLNHIDEQACAQYNVKILSLRGHYDFLRNVRATAEHTLALCLALLRNIPQAVHSVQHGQWQRDLFRGREIHEKTVGIIGSGRLGQLVAQYFHAFGARTITYDTQPDIAHPYAKQCSSQDELLQQSDIVTVHVNYTVENERMFGQHEFSQMKRHAILINTARGQLIDEAALLYALTHQIIAGAALDVLAQEPHINEQHPLVRYSNHSDNLLITPHIGGNTWDSVSKTEQFMAQQLCAYFETTH